MARKRMIDPSIWTDEGMAELTPRQQLLYIGLLSNADDEGRIRGSASSIRLILPTVYAAVDLGEVRGDLAQVLRAMRQLIAYEADGREYLAFRKYHHWQKIDRPYPSSLPPPPECSANGRLPLDDGSTNVPRTNAEQSPTIPASRARAEEEQEQEEKGIRREVEDEGGRAATAATPLAVPKPDRLAQVIDLIRDADFEPNVRGPDTKAVKNCRASPADIAATFVAIARDRFGDDFMRRKLSIAMACEYVDGWRASQQRQRSQPPAEDYVPYAEGFLGTPTRIRSTRSRGGTFG